MIKKKLVGGIQWDSIFNVQCKSRSVSRRSCRTSFVPVFSLFLFSCFKDLVPRVGWLSVAVCLVKRETLFVDHESTFQQFCEDTIMMKIQKGEQRDEVNRYRSIIFQRIKCHMLIVGCDGVIAELQNSNCSTSVSYPRRTILCTVKAPFIRMLGRTASHSDTILIIDSNISYKISLIFLFGGIGGVGLLSPSKYSLVTDSMVVGVGQQPLNAQMARLCIWTFRGAVSAKATVNALSLQVKACCLGMGALAGLRAAIDTKIWY